MDLKKEQFYHYSFIAGMIIKGIDGVLEFTGGLMLLFVKSQYITGLVQKLFRHELVQDPTDIIANYIIHLSQRLTTAALSFAALYLAIHGIIKIGLVTGLLLKKMWVYPVAGAVLAIFIIFQILEYFNTHSYILLFLTLVDIMILVLLRFEYKRLKKEESSLSGNNGHLEQ